MDNERPKTDREKNGYRGFEQGPIRPPSEAQSLLIRVTRNCPWNRCAFCPVYKGASFSIRPPEHVKRDIEAVHRCLELLEAGGDIMAAPVDMEALRAAAHWRAMGMRSVFLQDANSLLVKPRDLAEILRHLRERFPFARRVTSYARSHTLAVRREDDLRMLREAGLDRVHIGLESGSDAVLARVAKGCTKAQHILAGQKARAAGFEVSEYYMPGLGGRDLSRDHALESADALNQINPHFIRLRTLAIPNHTPLFAKWSAGRFEKCTDRMVAEEILLFLEHLQDITSVVKSDHILNLFGELEGKLPEDKPRMVALVRRFLDMTPEDQVLYQAGRRMGVFSRLDDLDDPRKRAFAEATCRRLAITPDNIDAMIDEVMKQFI